MTFGERLKKARIDSGINQADAAKKLEMSRPCLLYTSDAADE